MKVTKLPSGSFRVQVYLGYDVNGKKIRKSVTADTEWEVLKKAEELKRNYSNNNEDCTVYEAIDMYIKAKEYSLSPSTKRGYEIIRDNRLKLIRDVKCKDLSKMQVQRAINADAARLSRKSLQSTLGLLKSVLNMFEINLSLKSISLPPAVKKEPQLPELYKIIKAIKGTDIELACLLAMWLSLRVSEVRGLKFKDISEDGKYISVRRSKSYINGKDVLREQTKTAKSTRNNRLPTYIYKLIEKVPHTSDEDFIVDKGYNYISYHFKKLMKNIGYDISFHKLRHEFATTLNELGIPDEYIQKLGGWSTDNVMKSVYTHTRDAKENEYQDIIDNFYNGLIEKVKNQK